MKCIVAVCMSAAVAMAVADAFRIESTAVAPPSDILGEHQELQKTWTVYSEDSLEKLHISVPGPVFIALESSETTTTDTPAPSTETPAPSTEAPETDTPSPSTGEDDGDAYSTSSSSSSSGSGSNSNDTIQFPVMQLSHKHAKESKVATIVVSGNSSALLELLEVVALKKDDTNGVRLHLQNKDGQADGYVLTQITLTEANVVRHLSAALATSVDVASGVVVAKDSDNKIKIASAGTTNVFIAEDSDVHVNDLVVDVAGSGSVQWIVNGSVKVNGDLSTSVAGNGAIALHATSLEAEKLKTTLSGTGATYVVAKTLDVDSLETSVYGSAFASFNVENGTAKDHALTVSGSGVVYAGSIVAKKTDADIWGSGVAYVSVTDKLKASTSYSGHVYYVGARPDEVKTSGWFFWRSSVTPADANKIVEHAAVDSPAAYPEYIALVTKEARHSDEPIVTVDDGESVAFMVMTSHMAAVVHGPNGFLVVSVIGVGIVALAMVVQSYQHHRVRRHYTPLV